MTLAGSLAALGGARPAAAAPSHAVPGSGHAAAPAQAPAALSQARLSALLRRGAKLRKVPANLIPPLHSATHDVSLPWRLGCLIPFVGTTTSADCVFGDPSSQTTVVLFGDSHAAAWFPAVNLISQQHHWRLIFMGKAACPIAHVVVSRGGVPYTSCVTWRQNAEAAIAALHPEMVIATSAEYVGTAQPLTGRHTNHRDRTWLRGMAATFKLLRHDSPHVVFMADVPRLKQVAVHCVSVHSSNVLPCTVARNQAFLWPSVRRGELKLARADGVVGINPTPWFCTRTRCPVIVHGMLVYRDKQHILPTWATFLTPMLEPKLVGALQG